MAKKTSSMDFQINLQFVAKAKSELNSYVDKIKEIQSLSSGRLGSQFGKSMVSDINKALKGLNTLSKAMNNPGIKKGEKLRLINITGQDLAQLQTAIKGMEQYWKTELKNSAEASKRLDDLLDKRKQLTSVKSKITRNSNKSKAAEDELKNLGYQGGTTQKDKDSIASAIKNKNKLLNSQKEQGIIDNKELEQEISLLKAQEKEIKKIIDARKIAIELGKEVKALSAIGGSAGTSDTDVATKRLDKEISKEMAVTEDPEVSQKIADGYKSMIETITSTSEAGKSAVSDFSSGTRAELALLEEKEEETRQTTQSLKQVLASFGIGFSAVTIANYFKQLASDAFNFYRKLDEALVSIRVVTNLTSEAVQDLKGDFINMSKESGMAIDDITQSAVLFYQQGLDTSAVLEMTEVTAQFAKVAGIDATDAADKLTAAVNGYCLGAEDAALVADKFNKVAAASAADIDELSTAFSKAAAQANQAGVSMDNYLAYIATMEEATREAPENIGTSLKTIFSRMEQIKTAGSSEDGETDVNAVETALRTVGIQLRDSENQLRDLEDVLDELGGKWQSLDINTQAYLGTIIAGTRQQSRFITLMQNWDRVLQLSEDSQNSAGQQALMHQKSMESLDTAVQQLSNAWQTFLSNLTDSKAFKDLLKLLTSLLNLINKGNAPVTILGAAFAMLSKNLMKLGGPIVKGTKSLVLFSKRIVGLKGGLKGFTTNLGALKDNLTEAQHSFDKSEAVLEKSQDAYASAQVELTRLTQEYGENSQQVREQQVVVAQASETLKESAQVHKQNELNLKTSTEAYMNAANAMSTLTTVATAAVGIVTLLVSAFGLADDTSGQMTIAITSLVAGVGILVVAINFLKKNFKVAMAEMNTALISTGIGAIIVAIGMAISGLVTAFSALANSSENASKKMKEAVSNIGDKLEEVGTAKTAINQVEQLKEKYEELSSKVYLTSQEQKELNDTVQALGDTYDIDIMTDKYGNLSLSIAEVNERLAEEKEELAELNEELTKAEKEGYKDNKFQANEYYDKLFSKERSSYKSLLTGIDADVDVEDLRASAMEIENVEIELKNAIMDNAEEMAYWLGKEGTAISDYIVDINDDLNAAMDDDAWEDYYNMLGQLGEDINDLDYGQIQDKLDSFFTTFQKQCGLTTEQVQLLRQAMNDTLYADSNLDETIQSLEDSIDKQAILADKQKEIDEKYKNHWYNYLADGLLLQGMDLYLGTNMTASGRTLHKMQAGQEAVNEVNAMDTSETEQLIASLQRLTAASGEALGAIDAYSDLLDEEGNVLMTSQQFLEGLNIDAITSAFRDSKSAGYDELISQLADQIENTDNEELKKALQEKINDAVGELQITAEMTWTGLGEELDTLSSKLRSMNSIMAEFSENGGISLDTFQDLCEILEDVDMESLFQTGMIDQYLESLEKLNLGFDASTGYITAEGESMQTLQNLQEALAKAQLAATIQNLKNTKAGLEAELNVVEVEKQATQAAMAYLEQKGSGTVALSEIENAANEAYKTGMASAVDTALNAYSRMAKASAEWSQASIKNSGLVADAINKAYTEGLDESTVRDMMSSVTSGMNWEGLDSSGLYGASTDGKTIQVSTALAELQKYNAELDKTSQSIKLRIKNLDAMIVGMESMMNSDLGKLGNEEAAEELEKYIGQLEEIYNILRKIEGVEARLNNLEDYSDLAHGRDKAKYLQEEIDMTEELVGLNKDLLAAQKYMENTEQQAILNSPVGDVFSFDEFGNIIIDYEKYTALQDEAASGQQTLKELADNLYDEYQDLHGTTLEYYEDLVSSIEQSIDAQQELVDTYVDLETDLANAVKDIYQDMLDNKLEAINTEIDALDKLKEARDRANKAKDDSKDLSDMQTSLKRAMMDTSGASNTKVLSYQDQIKSKLEEMGEDEYTERLDAIRESLEKEQEQLQRNFDEFFEDWEQLYDLIESRVLSSEEATLEVLKTTDSYLHASDAERAQMLDGWRTDYAVAMTAMQNGGTIMDVVNSIFSLRDSIPDIDALLKDDEYYSKIGSTISQALQEYYNQDSGSGSSSSSSGGGGGGGYNPPKAETKVETPTDTSSKDKATTDVTTTISNWWTTFLGWINSASEAVGNFFTQTIPNWWTEHIWNPLTNFFTVSVPEWFGTAKETIVNWWNENIAPLFTLEYWKEKIGNIIYNVSYALTELSLDIQDFWNAYVAKYFTAEFWEEQWKKVCDAFSKGWDGIVEFFTQTVPQWWDENVAKFFTAEYWSGVWDGVVDGFKTGWNKVVTFFTQTIPQWWNDNVAKFFTKEYWLGVLGNIKQALSGWWSGVKSWFNNTIVAWWNNNIAKFFTAEYWSNKWTQIKNGFVSGIKKVANGIADIWNGFVDSIAGMFDWLESAWSWLTGKAKSGSSDAKKNHIPKYETGGIADFTGPAWLDGTKSEPEAVLNAAQTKAFMKLANNLDKLDYEAGFGSNVNIENISFHVDSMSSVEDGEIAFNAFVNKFKEIGQQSGLRMNVARLK